MIIFDDKVHSYIDENARKYNGVTGAICILLGKSFPDTEKVRIYTSFGSQVHREVELYVNNGRSVVIEASKMVVGFIKNISRMYACSQIQSEVIVTDNVATASCIDLVFYCQDGEVILADIKTGAFDRVYCTIQLQCYKAMFEKEKGLKVKKLFIISTKDENIYTIPLNTREKEVNAVFEMNKRELR